MEQQIRFSTTSQDSRRLFEKPMTEITRHFTGLLIGLVLVVAGLLFDSWWHARLGDPFWAPSHLIYTLGLVITVFASVRMFLAHIGLLRRAATGAQYRLKSIRTAILSLYIGIAGAGLLLLGAFLDSSWHDQSAKVKVKSAAA